MVNCSNNYFIIPIYKLLITIMDIIKNIIILLITNNIIYFYFIFFKKEK